MSNKKIYSAKDLPEPINGLIEIEPGTEFMTPICLVYKGSIVLVPEKEEKSKDKE